MRTSLAALLLLTGASAPSLVLAADPYGPEASLAWSMGFGGDSPGSNYAVTLAYQGPEVGAPALQVAEWRVQGELGVARVAGLPVLAHNYRTNQTDDPIAYGSNPLSWVWWVASGALVTVWALDAADSDDDPPVTGTGSGS